MNQPSINFKTLNNIERTIRANEDNMRSIPPRVNLNIVNDGRRNSLNSGNENLSDDELGMDILANPKRTRPKSTNSNVDLSERPAFNFDPFQNNQEPQNFGNSGIQVNKVNNIDDDIESVHSHHSNNSNSTRPNLEIPEHFDNENRRDSLNSNDRSSIDSSDYDEPKSPRTILREKRKLLFKLRRYEKKGYKLSGKFSINTPLEEIQCEYETIRKEANLEQSMKVSKNILISVCSVLEFMNNKFDPMDIVLDGWSEEVNEDVENGDYDEVLEDLYDKYADAIEMGPELKLLMMIGGSAVKFHLTHTILKTVIPGAETLLKQNPGLKNDIAGLIQKNVPGLDINNFNIMPKPDEMAQGISKNNSSPNQRREMQGPQNVDDIIKELEENDFDNINKKSSFNVGKRGKNTLSIDLI